MEAQERIAVCLLTGFMQPERISNGLADVRRAIEPLNPAELISTGWLCDINAIAKRILAVKPTKVVVAGHSKGGNTGNNLCGLLGFLGQRTHSLFLCDAFGGHVGRATIIVPKCVDFVWVWRGTRSAIKGSRVEREEDAACLMLERVTDRTPHRLMDELPEFQAAVLAAVGVTK